MVGDIGVEVEGGEERVVNGIMERDRVVMVNEGIDVSIIRGRGIDE